MATAFNVGEGIRDGANNLTTPDPATHATTGYTVSQRDGLDMLWGQQYLSGQMQKIEEEILAIEANANLSDTERMFAMQTAMNTWSAISNLRTNMLKSVSDTLKAIVRNLN